MGARASTLIIIKTKCAINTSQLENTSLRLMEAVMMDNNSMSMTILGFAWLRKMNRQILILKEENGTTRMASCPFLMGDSIILPEITERNVLQNWRTLTQTLLI